MKKVIFCIILILNISFIYADINNPPAVPDNIYGDIFINTEPAKIGTIIVAKINNFIVGDYNTIENGYFGSETINNRFLISGYFLDIDNEINFYLIIDDTEILGETNPEPITFLSGENQNVNIFFNYVPDNNIITDENIDEDLNVIDENINIPLPPTITPPQTGGGNGNNNISNLENTTTVSDSNIDNNIIDNNFETNTEDINLNYPYSKAEDTLNFPKIKKDKSNQNIFKTEEKNKLNYKNIFFLIIIIGIIVVIYILYTRRNIYEK